MSYIPSKSHWNGPSGDLSDPRYQNDGRSDISTRQSGGKSKGNSKAIGDTDDDVTDHLAGSEVLLFMVVQKQLLLLELVLIILRHFGTTPIDGEDWIEKGRAVCFIGRDGGVYIVGRGRGQTYFILICPGWLCSH